MPRGGSFVETALRKGFRKFRGLPWTLKLCSWGKYRYLDFLLSVLAAAFEAASVRVPELREELASWEEGRTFALGVLPKGPAITLVRENGRVRYLGKGLRSPRVSFLFKNLDAALPVFSGLMGSHHAVAESRILVNGSISGAMELSRALISVETHLFPGFILKRILKRPPPFDIRRLILRGKVWGAVAGILVRRGFGRKTPP